jgi:hypothetical protein
MFPVIPSPVYVPPAGKPFDMVNGALNVHCDSNGFTVTTGFGFTITGTTVEEEEQP